MKNLPPDVSKYGASAEFTQESVPEKLLKSHRTKPGTWGRIVVSDGRLLYRIVEPEQEDYELSPGVFGIIEPEVLHYVQPLGQVRFCVEFYR